MNKKYLCHFLFLSLFIASCGRKTSNLSETESEKKAQTNYLKEFQKQEQQLAEKSGSGEVSHQVADGSSLTQAGNIAISNNQGTVTPSADSSLQSSNQSSNQSSTSQSSNYVSPQNLPSSVANLSIIQLTGLPKPTGNINNNMLVSSIELKASHKDHAYVGIKVSGSINSLHVVIMDGFANYSTIVERNESGSENHFDLWIRNPDGALSDVKIAILPLNRRCRAEDDIGSEYVEFVVPFGRENEPPISCEPEEGSNQMNMVRKEFGTQQHEDLFRSGVYLNSNGSGVMMTHRILNTEFAPLSTFVNEGIQRDIRQGVEPGDLKFSDMGSGGFFGVYQIIQNRLDLSEGSQVKCVGVEVVRRGIKACKTWLTHMATNVIAEKDAQLPRSQWKNQSSYGHVSKNISVRRPDLYGGVLVYPLRIQTHRAEFDYTPVTKSRYFNYGDIEGTNGLTLVQSLNQSAQYGDSVLLHHMTAELQSIGRLNFVYGIDGPLDDFSNY